MVVVLGEETRTSSKDLLSYNPGDLILDAFKIRDERSVKKIVSGLLKLLFPDKSFSREELRRVIEVAVEYRQRVRDWLHKVDPGEFPKEKLVVTVRG